MFQHRRRTYLVDAKVQGALILRVLAYWAYCVFSISLLLIMWEFVAGQPKPFLSVLSTVYQRFVPAAAASLLILPLAVMDLLRMSNRLAGPVRRLRNALSELGEGKDVPPLMFRDNDFWQETAAEFNRVNDRIKQLSHRKSKSQADDDCLEALPFEELVKAGRVP